MKFWGKVLGGVGGFLVGGPLGGVVGAMLGHAADEDAIPVQRADWSRLANWRPIAGSNRARVAAMFGRRDQVFTFSVVSLAAKLCKCDGPIKRIEIDAFKQHFHINPDSVHSVGRMFDRARDSAESVEDMAAPLADAFVNNRALLEEVMVALYGIARSDGPLTPPERDFLGRAHRALGLDQLSWNRVHQDQQDRHDAYSPQSHAQDEPEYHARSSTRQGSQQRQRPKDQRRGERRAEPPRQTAEPTPYQILGVDPSASDDDVRSVWRNLMRENHPDRLSARQVPPEFIARASEKVARINAAWDVIKRQRGL